MYSCNPSFFDELLSGEEFTTKKTVTSPNAKIVHSATFENALVKLQNGQESLLNDIEKESINLFKNSSSIMEDARDVLSAIKNLPKSESQYQSTSWIPSTSNVCERFFSKV